MESAEEDDFDWTYIERLQRQLRKMVAMWRKSKWRNMDESEYLQRHSAIDRKFLLLTKQLRMYDVYQAIHHAGDLRQSLSGNPLDADAEAMRLFVLFLRSPVRHTLETCKFCGKYFGNVSGLSKFCCREHKTEFINEKNRRRRKVK